MSRRGYQPALLELREITWNLSVTEGPFDYVVDDEQTVYFDLLHGARGVYLDEWRPARSVFKDGGVWQNSPFTNGRLPVFARYDDVTETVRLKYRSDGQDAAIYEDGALDAMLQRATQYLADTNSNKAVCLVMLPRGATSPQYALVKEGKIRDSENPFAAAFNQDIDNASTWEGIELTIVRGQWTENPPNIGTAVAMQVRSDADYSNTYADRIVAESPIGLWPLTETSGVVADELVNGYDGTLDTVTFGDPGIRLGEFSVFFDTGAGSCDIGVSGVLNAFDGTKGTAIMWIRNSGVIWNSGFRHTFFRLYTNASNQIEFFKSATDYTLGFSYIAGGTGATLTATTSEIFGTDTPDEWFSVAIRWARTGTNNTTLVMHLYVNGRFVRSESFTNPAWSGALTAATIGAQDKTGTNASASDMNYVALFREALPTDTIIDLINNIGNSEAETTTAGGKVFVANKRQRAQITHLFNYDASSTSFSSNQINKSLPLTLFPASPAVGDIVYFIVQSGTGTPAGPIDNVIFDIATGASSTTSYTLTWEYYNGSWTALSASVLNDRTNSFTELGVNGVFWERQSDATTVTINGITGWAVRVRLSALTGTFTRPTQQNRDIYTSNRPYIHIPRSGTAGDMANLARLMYANQLGDNNNHAPYYTNTLYIGARTYARGELFSAYLNATDQPFSGESGVTCTKGANTVFGSSPLSPTGRRLVYTPAGSSSTFSTTAVWSLGSGVANQYAGTYLAFVRIGSGGSYSAGDFRFRIALRKQILTLEQVGRPVSLRAINGQYQIYQLGPVTIPAQGDAFDVGLALQVAPVVGATKTIYIYDLILIPVDEFACRLGGHTTAIGGEFLVSGNTWFKGMFDVSSLGTKKSLRAVVRDWENGLYINDLIPMANDQLVLAPGEVQRLWMLAVGATSGGSHPEMTAKVIGLKRNAQYRNMRGGG